MAAELHLKVIWMTTQKYLSKQSQQREKTNQLRDCNSVLRTKEYSLNGHQTGSNNKSWCREKASAFAMATWNDARRETR
jgi:hypothetical protein